MKRKAYIIALFAAVISSLLSGCSSGDGPLLINTSGQSIRLVVHSADGTTYEGDCEDQSAAWTGKPKAIVSKIEIFMGVTKYELSGEALSVRYGRDKTTAFIIESTGPRKLALDEAKVLMRGK